MSSFHRSAVLTLGIPLAFSVSLSCLQPVQAQREMPIMPQPVIQQPVITQPIAPTPTAPMPVAPIMVIPQGATPTVPIDTMPRGQSSIGDDESARAFHRSTGLSLSKDQDFPKGDAKDSKKGVLFRAHKETKHTSRNSTEDGTIGSDSLESGILLVSVRNPAQDALVETPLGKICVHRGADALVTFHDGVLRVHNLNGKPGTVRVKLETDAFSDINKRVLALDPTWELVAGPDITNNDTEPSDGIARRYAKPVEKGRISISEVSTESLLKTHPLLSRLDDGDISPQEKSILNTAYKVAAVLAFVEGGQGFKIPSHPQPDPPKPGDDSTLKLVLATPEVKLANQTVEQKLDGTIITTIKFPDGRVVTETKKPDGTVITVTKYPDGTVIVVTKNTDGTVVTKTYKTDGTLITQTKYPGGGVMTETKSPDGQVQTITQYPDGKTVKVNKYPGGIEVTETWNTDLTTNTVTKYPDGTVVTTTTDLQGGLTTITTKPDGTQIIETKSLDGSSGSYTTKPDGTSVLVEIYPDGTKITKSTLPDGTYIKVTEKPDGTVITETTPPGGTTTTTTTGGPLKPLIQPAYSVKKKFP